MMKVAAKFLQPSSCDKLVLFHAVLRQIRVPGKMSCRSRILNWYNVTALLASSHHEKCR
jgi:hypothetical protein